jgi:N6-adenosine-specific RNA methylase IME4
MNTKATPILRALFEETLQIQPAVVAADGNSTVANREAESVCPTTPNHGMNCDLRGGNMAAATKTRSTSTLDPARDLSGFVAGKRFATILADPPWRFQNSTGKVAPEHRRLSRYGTLSFETINTLPVGEIAAPTAHLYLWVPNALLPQGLAAMEAWGFTYKSNVVWHKVRKDGGSDGRGVGFYFRNVTELVLFGVRGKNARTLAPGRRQVNLIATRKREHSRKPDELYSVIEACSPGPYLELFARGTRPGWHLWGNQADDNYRPSWPTYKNNSGMMIAAE